MFRRAKRWTKSIILHLDKHLNLFTISWMRMSPICNREICHEIADDCKAAGTVWQTDPIRPRAIRHVILLIGWRRAMGEPLKKSMDCLRNPSICCQNIFTISSRFNPMTPSEQSLNLSMHSWPWQSSLQGATACAHSWTHRMTHSSVVFLHLQRVACLSISWQAAPAPLTTFFLTLKLSISST